MTSALQLHRRERHRGVVTRIPLRIESTRTSNTGTTIAQLDSGHEINLTELLAHGKTVVIGGLRVGLEACHESDAVFLTVTPPPPKPATTRKRPVMTLECIDRDMHTVTIRCADCEASSAVHVRGELVRDAAGFPLVPMRLAAGADERMYASAWRIHENSGWRMSDDDAVCSDVCRLRREHADRRFTVDASKNPADPRLNQSAPAGAPGTRSIPDGRGGYLVTSVREFVHACPSCDERFRVHQTRGDDGEWPDPKPLMERLGWVFPFCSRLHADRHAVATREPVAPVTKIDDAHYQQQRQPKNMMASEEGQPRKGRR